MTPFPREASQPAGAPSGPVDWLAHYAAVTPSAPFLKVPEQPWISYGAAQQRVAALRAGLWSLGVREGSRVLLALPNVPANALGWLAVQSLGATVVEVDREWGELPLSEALAQTRPALVVLEGRDARRWGRLPHVTSCLVVHPTPPPGALSGALLGRFAGWLSEAGELPEASSCSGDARQQTDFRSPPPLTPSGVAGPAWTDDPAAGRPGGNWPRPLDSARCERGAKPLSGRPVNAPAVARVPTDDARIAQIIFTSGSTGAPRGVQHTLRNVAASAQAIASYLELTAADRALLVLPLFYVYGKSVLSSHLLVGGSVVLDERFMYPRVVMASLASEGCTNFSGVPVNYESLRRQVDFSTIERGSLRFLTQAGGAMAPETIDWVRATFAPAKLFVMYGQAEATARLSYLPPERAVDKRGSVGRGIPGVKLEVVDELGRPVPSGVVGELTARGEVVMPGYLDAPEETAKVLRDGRLFTGDLATHDDDGFVFIVGRSRAMLKLGGHRVAPGELERVLRLHPLVREAAVVGAKDALEGEVAVAFVVPAGPGLDEPALLRHCRANLPASRVPRRVALVEALPRNTFGKVLLAELQRRAAALTTVHKGDSHDELFP